MKQKLAPHFDASGIEAQNEIIRAERRANNTWNKLSRNKTAVFGLTIILIMFILAVFAPLIANHDPNALSISEAFKKPGYNGHIFGTDEFGRDLFSRVIYGARISILVAVGGTLVGSFLGLLLGLIAGYQGGIVDSIIMRIMDSMFAFPFILLSIIMMTVLGAGINNVILAIGISNVPNFARVVRGQTHIIKNEQYCRAARALGASDTRILLRHILPNAISPLIVYSTLSVAGSIISEAALSFLGLGISPPMASWGNILQGGRNYLRTAPHIATISGFFILITVLGFNLLGDGIRDVFDPKMKK